MNEWKRFYVDQAEEINTVISQIKGLPEKKIALVIDENNRLFTQKTNLKLLQFYLAKEGKELLLVSPNSLVQELATELNMPIAATLDESEKPIKRITTNRETKRYRWLPFYLAAFLCLIGLLFYYWPTMLIEIVPSVKNVQTEMLLDLSPHYKEVVRGKLPAKFYEKEIFLEAERKTTGTKKMGIKKATGQVLLINEGSRAITLVQGTKVSTVGGIGFFLTQSVTVPGRRVESFMGVPVGLVAGQAERAIEAIEPGTLGNVAAGEVNRINIQNLRVINSAPMHGGEYQVLKIVSEEDLTKLEKELQRKAKQELLKQLKKEAGKSEQILDDSLHINALAIRYDKNSGMVTETIKASLQTKGSLLAFSQLDLQQLSRGYLQEVAGKDYVLTEGKTQLISMSGQLAKPDLYRLQVKMGGLVEAKVDVKKWKKELQAYSLEGMKKNLLLASEIGSFSIQKKFFNSEKIPRALVRTKISIKNQGEKE